MSRYPRHARRSIWGQSPIAAVPSGAPLEPLVNNDGEVLTNNDGQVLLRG